MNTGFGHGGHGGHYIFYSEIKKVTAANLQKSPCVPCLYANVELPWTPWTDRLGTRMNARFHPPKSVHGKAYLQWGKVDGLPQETKQRSKGSNMNISMLARRSTQVALWWASVPNERRPLFIRPKDLEIALHLPMAEIALPLRLAGWTRDVCRLSGTPSVIWVPPKPFGKSPKLARGRPSLASICLGAT